MGGFVSRACAGKRGLVAAHQRPRRSGVQHPLPTETPPAKTDAPKKTPAKPAEPKPAETKPAEPKPKLKTSVPSAKKLFEAAREKLRTRSYRAKIVQKFNYPQRALEATGQIVRGQKFRLRLEFQIHSGGTTGELLQVCNGDKLWTQRKINDVTKLTVQDVKEILTKAGTTPENVVVAELGLGGIASLLASMERSMNFGEPQTVEIDGEQLLVVEGEWNEGFLAQVKANPQLAKGYADFLPDGGRVYFDRDDFPRRIQYLKKESQHATPRPLVTIDFRDVKWLGDADVKPSLFEYEQPAKVYPEDVTKTYVDQLKPRPAPAPPQP